MKVAEITGIFALASLACSCIPGCVCWSGSGTPVFGSQPGSPVFASGRVDTTSRYRSQTPDDADWLPSPVYKVVHREVNGPGSKTYHAMVSPWPLRPDGSSDPFSTKQSVLHQEWTLAAPTATAFDTAGMRGLPSDILAVGTREVPDFAGALPALAQFDAVAIDQTGGYGWIYLTGDKPIVKTRWVVGGADGTTFFCQVARNGRTEYHRFALINTPQSEPGEQVTLRRLQSPGPGEPVLTHQLPYAVYVCSSTDGSGQWHGPFADMPAGPEWNGMADAMKAARKQAILANLPVSDEPVNP